MTSLPSSVPPEALRARRERLIEASAQAGFGMILATRPEHVRYLTGSDGPGPRALIVGPGTTKLVAPSEPDDADDIAAQDIDVVTFLAYSPGRLVYPAAGFADVLGPLVASAGPTRIGCDTPSIHGRIDSLRGAEIADAADLFAAARRPRDRWEIAEIRARVTIVEAGLRAARSAAAVGVSELEVAISAIRAISHELGEIVSLDHNIGSGPRSALEDPHASARLLAVGELLLVDLYPPLRGYFADLTRTWVVGPTPSDAARGHEAVVAALRSGERLLGPGVPVAAIDRAVRGSLRAAGGLDATMGHHTGHGLGIFAWEHPWIGSGSADVLMAGDVVALEPGTYRAGFGGVRVEGNYLITEDGYERIDTVDEDLAA
jgi:Xaa-Pro aminopeptidase